MGLLDIVSDLNVKYHKAKHKLEEAAKTNAPKIQERAKNLYDRAQTGAKGMKDYDDWIKKMNS